MKRNPTGIICEYLNRAEPQVRKNALTALAAIGDQDSIERLITAALEDPAPEVRSHAEAEIAKFEGPVAESARDHLHRLLEDKDPKRRATTYALLGRLRVLGFPALRPALSWLKRWRLAASLRSHPSIPRRPFFHGPLLRTSLFAGVAGAILISVYLIIALKIPLLEADFLIFMLLLGPILSVVIALFAARNSMPAGLQYDGAAANVAETSSLAVRSVIPVFLGLLLASYNTLPHQENSEWLVIALFGASCLVLALATVRGGTFLALGVARNSSWKRRLPIAAGTACGFFVLTLPLVMHHVSAIYSGRAEKFVEALWLCLLPSILGLAATLAQIDREPEVPGLTASRPARILTFSLCAFLVALPVAAALRVVWIRHNKQEAHKQKLLMVPDKGGKSRTDLGDLPMKQPFMITTDLHLVAEIKETSPQTHSIEVDDDFSLEPSNFHLRLHKYKEQARCPEGVKEVVGDVNETSVQHVLKPGCYDIEVSQTESPLEIGNVLAAFWKGGRPSQSAKSEILELLFDTNTCLSADDGHCDEPDVCPKGSDAKDCGPDACRFANDGFCNEPEYCQTGTDSTDCKAHPMSKRSLDDSCQFAKDNECDEPSTCNPGTDFSDCRVKPTLTTLEPASRPPS